MKELEQGHKGLQEPLTRTPKENKNIQIRQHIHFGFIQSLIKPYQHCNIVGLGCE